MNRVLGDYMETMLYKIFVSIDEQTKISEVSNVTFHFRSSINQNHGMFRQCLCYHLSRKVRLSF